ncbi:FAD-binding oxidoreductase [Ktedonospora formicarum]|uniref:Oxidoreductase n=1 Tax=Ktedonospora formicarum TaxID=2778364 RepID=A0A8J3MXY3_9CHLR|nr:FAD-binding oxidoreductase [Ktedonospora formicarum]GHO49085.1 oxidoreductase [Ktedonospora formicarum]
MTEKEHNGQNEGSPASVLPKKEQIEAFKSGLRGELIQRGDVRYNEARKVYNAMIDKHPILIVLCADVSDVIAAVNFGRENNLLVAIRSGGHNAGGLGICENGLVIDLSLIHYTRVDPTAGTALVGGGCTWGDVDHATHAFGLAVPSGFIASTGVGGLTLGGGIGHLTRKCGLTIDNLLAADVVLADGRFVTASERQNEDLFWALRGGGGNFGVVTSFLFKAHPINIDYAGPMLWELDQAPEIMAWYRALLPQAPEDLSGFFVFLVVPPAPPFPAHLHNRRMCGVVWCYTGPLEKAEEVFKPIRGYLAPVLDLVGPIPHPALQSMFDALYVPGLQWYWKADFFNELSDEVIRLHVKHSSHLPTMHSTIHLYPVNGAAHRVGKQETAWSYRDATWAEVIVGVDPDPAKKDRIVNWARNYWNDLHPYSAGGSYVNFMMEEGEERVKASYRDNYERLQRIKRVYDPMNFFRVNQNITPAR